MSPYGYLFARGACDTPNLSFTTFDKLDRNPPALIYRELCLSNELTGERFDLMLTGWKTGRPADFATTERFSIRWEDVTAPLCRDGRVCTPDSAESVSCACPAGTLADASGACVDIDNCADNPCGLGGVCFDIGDDYACVCPDERVRFEKESFEVSDGDCVAPDICLNRDDTGPLYNASRETGGAAGDDDHRPDGVRFRPGACDGTRWFDELFSSNVIGLLSGLNFGFEEALACAQLVETGVEFEMRFTRYDDLSGSIDSIDGSRGFIDEGDRRWGRVGARRGVLRQPVRSAGRALTRAHVRLGARRAASRSSRHARGLWRRRPRRQSAPGRGCGHSPCRRPWGCRRAPGADREAAPEPHRPA